MVYLAAGSRSNRRDDRFNRRAEGTTMPRTTRQPLDERARARLRDAQRVESDDVALVQDAVINRGVVQARLDAVIAKHQVAIDEADHTLSKTQAHLVSVSGIERAALLVDQPVATLRAAVRAATGSARQEPA